MAELAGTDLAMFAAEYTSASSTSLWAVFDRINVDDKSRETINQAYARAFTPEGGSPWDHYQDALNSPNFDNTFMSPLKGAVAEIQLKNQLNQRGWNVDLAHKSNQSGWDIQGTNADGEFTRIQVKTGSNYSAGDVQDHMNKYPLV